MKSFLLYKKNVSYSANQEKIKHLQRPKQFHFTYLTFIHLLNYRISLFVNKGSLLRQIKKGQ